MNTKKTKKEKEEIIKNLETCTNNGMSNKINEL